MLGVAVAKQICEAADQIDSAEMPLIEDTPDLAPHRCRESGRRRRIVYLDTVDSGKAWGRGKRKRLTRHAVRHRQKRRWTARYAAEYRQWPMYSIATQRAWFRHTFRRR